MTKDCEEILKQKCPEVTPECLDQMDTYLTGKCGEAINDYKECMKKNMVEFDSEYLRIVNNILDNGTWQMNERTGKRCLFYHGDMMKFDLSSGHFPLLTTKQMKYKSMIGELIGFLRGVNNAKDFRDLKCKFWDANANESVHWLENPNRKGEDDLGRIYGVQARDWKKSDGSSVDQLRIVVDKLSRGIDDRRLIVSHWNVGELDKMALVPCHMTYQFGIRDGHLDLCMYQRSCDVPLGIPMNIASYALLLNIVAKMTGLKPGIFTHFMWNIHIYEDQIENIKKQVIREPLDAPKLVINDGRDLNTVDDLDKLEVDDFNFINYNHQGEINFPFSA